LFYPVKRRLVLKRGSEKLQRSLEEVEVLFELSNGAYDIDFDIG